MVKQPELAFWLERPSIAVCEIAALLGYRTVILDMEHGAMGAESCDSIVAMSRALGLRCLVRVAAATRLLIQQALDYDADGVILPQIEDVHHAREVCKFAKYPPLGARGVGYSRAMKYGIDIAIGDEFFVAENQRTTCHPMIETAGALRDVAAIAALNTVDGIFIGPSDLSISRGRGAFSFRAGDKADFLSVVQAVRNQGKDFALPAPSAAVYAFAREQGASYVTVCDDLTALRVGLEKGLEVAKGVSR